ncbi:VUT family protein [Parashewanella curva]|uniref:Queuosine precursor transporter n=1 Tax=Parashewanella curva TaxID=2338552 RepID=A0A3L8PUE7_9GAMM|nr:queuosine precursor transporter [Parashewanella curva]RLV58038.1 VUT family protein [Parashewanella curva]
MVKLENNSRLLFILAFYIVMLCLTVCFANNFISPLGVTIPGGVLFFPFSFIVCDIVGEVYGYEVAKIFIWAGITAELLFAGLSEVMIVMPHPSYFNHAGAYQSVFEPTMRYVLSAIAGLFSGDFLNIYILSRWKIAWKGRLFIIRSICTTGVGQMLLSLVVVGAAFSGKVSSEQLVGMMVSGWKIKMLYSFWLSLPACLLVRYLKNIDKVDHYDIGISYNPFKI